MIPALGLLASQLAILAAGYSLLWALGIAELKSSDARLIGLSYLAGWASTGVLLVLALVLGAGESLPVILAVLAAQIGAFLWLGRRAEPVGPPASPVVQSRRLLATVVCWVSGVLIGIAILSAAAVASKVGWDAWQDYDALNFWIPRAQILHHSHGLNAELWRLFAHREYPPLAPAMDAYTFFFAGVHPSLLITQRTILGIAFLLSLVALLGRVVPRWFLLPFVATLATAPWFWPRLSSLMVDAPVTFFVSAAAIAGFHWLHERRGCWLALAGVFLAAGALAKSEGFFFSEILAVTLVAAGVVRFRRGAARALVLLAAPLLIAFWWLWLASHGTSAANSADYHLSDIFDLHYLSDRRFRLARVLAAYRREGETLLSGVLAGWHVPGVSGWLLLIPAVAAFLLAARRYRLLGVAAAAWVVAALAGLAVIYWIGRPGIGWYIGVTLYRIAPTILIAGGALGTMLLGLELRVREGHASESAPPVPRKCATARRRITAAWCAVVAALVVAVLADSRPSVYRTGPIDGTALGRELAVQVTQELASAGYLYHITAACNQASSQGLDFACVARTTGPVGGSATNGLHWHISVSCAPAATTEPRCVTSQGEALS